MKYERVSRCMKDECYNKTNDENIVHGERESLNLREIKGWVACRVYISNINMNMKYMHIKYYINDDSIIQDIPLLKDYQFISLSQMIKLTSVKDTKQFRKECLNFKSKWRHSESSHISLKLSHNNF